MKSPIGCAIFEIVLNAQEIKTILTDFFSHLGLVYARLKASWNSNINADSEKKMDFEVCKSHRIHLPYAIITRGYPIFHCGLYCRAVYTAERLVFHDSFLSNQGCIHGCIKGCLFTYKNKLTFFTNIFIFSLL